MSFATHLCRPLTPPYVLTCTAVSSKWVTAMTVRFRSSSHEESHSGFTFPLFSYHTGTPAANRSLFVVHSPCPAGFIWLFNCFLPFSIGFYFSKKKLLTSKDSALRSTPITGASTLLWPRLTSGRGPCYAGSLVVASACTSRPPTVNSYNLRCNQHDLLPLFTSNLPASQSNAHLPTV